MNTEDAAIWMAIGVLAITVLVLRALYLYAPRRWQPRGTVAKALRFAPLAALMAVVAPEFVLHQGELVTTWRDARLWSAAAGLAWYFWQRGILGTIVAGMAVYLPLRLGLGW